MEPPGWEIYSFEPVRTLVDAASRDLANARLSPEEKVGAMRLAMGFQWAKTAIRSVGAARISAAARRAIRRHHAKDLARKWIVWLHRIWLAPPELSAEGLREWWNLVAIGGLSGRASGGQWRKLFEEPKEILIFAPSDLAGLGKVQPHIVSEGPQSYRLLGHLRRAAKVAGGAEELAVRPCPSTYALHDWDARRLVSAISADSANDS